MCTKALSTEQFDILAKYCPEQAQTVAQKQCAGRQYTSQMDPKYRDFCVAYASAAMQQGTPQEQAVETEKQGMKKRLKGLLGR
jgi:hypothetical protein